MPGAVTEGECCMQLKESAAAGVECRATLCHSSAMYA